ncbi:Ig-like domain-containing protein [Embleya sp. NBC_00896]|uniref:NHL domain-containing protein n=1 Tax=Embleya sp. NBC_00896 TaxID=2975961 RepID=UPI003866F2CE|nr:Ig-like domain-containing protein [Embleya sp. NBC_00896]
MPTVSASPTSLHRAAAVLACSAALFGTTCAAAGAVQGDRRVTTIAGTGARGFSGDGGPGVAARLDAPAGLAWDPAGNLYIADSRANRVRRLAPDGTITTVAGTGSAGFGGDGGPATAARLSAPRGLACGPAGELYIADRENDRVRKVDAAGLITTVAGTGIGGFSGDGGPAGAARFSDPDGLALGPGGELYIADRANDRVRRVDAGGVVETVAGNGSGLGTPVRDGGPAVATALYEPVGIAVDAAGNLLIADRGHHRVRVVDPAGTISTFAGADVPPIGPPPASGDGGLATSAVLRSPQSLAIGPDDAVYIGDGRAGRIRRVAPTGLIDTITGGGHDRTGKGVPAATAALVGSEGLAVRSDGSLAYADGPTRRVRLIARPASARPPAPRALADAADTLAGESVDVPILTGDMGDGLALLSHTNPEHGLVLRPDDGPGADPVLRYTPGPGFTGSDVFRYTITDRLGRQATATVRVEVAPAGAGHASAPGSGRIGAYRGVDALHPPRPATAPNVGSNTRPRPADSTLAATGTDGWLLLLAYLGAALLGAGVLALVAYRRPARRGIGRRAARGHAFRVSRPIR